MVEFPASVNHARLAKNRRFAKAAAAPSDAIQGINPLQEYQNPIHIADAANAPLMARITAI